MICAIHPKGRGPGTKSCYTCIVIKKKTRNRELAMAPREVGMRPIENSKTSYGLENINWPAPKV